MILVTLGTQKEQFTRLLDYIEKSKIKDEIIVQAGYTKYTSKKMKIFDFINYDEMDKYIEKADIVITHAGTGSVLTPLKKGKKVIICSRLSKYHEHVDNHQQELADMFRDAGYVLELTENNNLDDLMIQLIRGYLAAKLLLKFLHLTANLLKPLQKLLIGMVL